MRFYIIILKTNTLYVFFSRMAVLMLLQMMQVIELLQLLLPTQKMKRYYSFCTGK